MAANITFICDCCEEKILDSKMFHGKSENEYHLYNKTFYERFGKTKLSADIKISASQAQDCICEKCALEFLNNKITDRLKEINNET
jgi:hypothetical protein